MSDTIDADERSGRVWYRHGYAGWQDTLAAWSDRYVLSSLVTKIVASYDDPANGGYEGAASHIGGLTADERGLLFALTAPQAPLSDVQPPEWGITHDEGSARSEGKVADGVQQHEGNAS